MNLTAADVRAMKVGIAVTPENEDHLVELANAAPNGTVAAFFGINYALEIVAKKIESEEPKKMKCSNCSSTLLVPA